MPEKKRYSIDAQIAEVDRELKMRRDVYGRMSFPSATFKRKAEADMALEIMEAVRETLLWAKENREDVKAWMQAGKPESKRAAPAEGHGGLRAALEAIAQKANEYGPGHLAAIGCIHDMHALARAGLASHET